MPIESVCPSCGVRLLIPRKLIGSGRSKSCPKCHALLPIVADTGASAPPRDKAGAPRPRRGGKKKGGVSVSSPTPTPFEAGSTALQGPTPPATFPCQFCHGPILHDASLAGQPVECPHCRNQLTMPEVEVAAEVACPYCNAHLPSRPENAGKVILCRNCRGQVQMP